MLYEEQFKAILKARMAHCINELHKNVNHSWQDENCVYWEGGHFSKPVYMEMLNAMDMKADMWSALIWQQIIRHMYLNKLRQDEMFMIATEMMLVMR